jgi:cleavage and polyadenylation specificity factor subunit 4
LSFPSWFRFFIIKSANRENLELSTRRGAWATHRNNEQRLNAAFDTVANVILIYSINESRHFQGCARMESKVGATNATGQWKYAHGTAQFGRNFRLRWLKVSCAE